MIPIKSDAPSPRVPTVTILLIVANSLVFLIEASMEREALRTFIRTYGFVPAEFWRTLSTEPGNVIEWGGAIVASMFMHGSWGHLIGNMLFLWVFGDAVENRIGRARYIVFYVLVGAAALFVHGAFMPASTTPTVGASGAIAGVLGAYLLLYPKSRVLMVIPVFFYPFFFEILALFFLGFWFAQQFLFGVAATAVESGAVGGVAWWAHIGGFVAGAAAVSLLKLGKDEPEERDDGESHWMPLGREHQKRPRR